MLSPRELQALWRSPRTDQFHAGVPNSPFANFHVFDRAMAERLGAPRSLRDWERKAQLLNYEGERAEFEAFRRNMFDGSTGVIQWMLENAWPSLHWNLFDWYLDPAGSYFGAKEANRPLHVQYSYDDRSVAVVNESADPENGLSVTAAAFAVDGSQVWSRRTSAQVPSEAVRRVLTVPLRPDWGRTYFVRLQLRDRSGRLVDSNTYWLSSKPDVPDYPHSRWWYMPTKRFADLRALATLPEVDR